MRIIGHQNDLYVGVVSVCVIDLGSVHSREAVLYAQSRTLHLHNNKKQLSCMR